MAVCLPHTEVQVEVKLMQRGRGESVVRRSGLTATGEASVLAKPNDKLSSAVRSESCMKEEVRVLFGGGEWGDRALSRLQGCLKYLCVHFARRSIQHVQFGALQAAS